MAYETKVLLVALSEMALTEKAEGMYKKIAKMANVEGIVLKSYDEAIKELEE